MLKRSSLLSLMILGLFQGICANSTIIPTYDIKNFNNEINFLYSHVISKKMGLRKKIETTSQYFLGREYINGALGEGFNAEFDKSPIYRTDAFDCVTFVSTVLALVQSNSCSEFLHILIKINYKHSQVSYFNRYHFTDIDWNLANEEMGYIQDITSKITDHYKVAYTYIDKPTWYRHHTAESLKNFSALSLTEQNNLLKKLYDYGQHIAPCWGLITYISLPHLFQCENGKWVLNKTIINQMPSGAIIEIVDQTQHFKEKIGTDLNVVHLGFFIRYGDKLFFRHASKPHHQVVDAPFGQYLLRTMLLSRQPEQVGIHIERIKNP